MAAAGPSGDVFDSFYTEVKAIEKRDSKLTSKQQIDRLLRPGSSYFNLNPFEVLQIEPDTKPEEAKRIFKKMSLLLHPDKNLEDKERAETAFDVIKTSIKQIEDPDELSRCRDVVEEAKARTNIMISEKRRQLKKENKVAVVEEDEPEAYKRAVWCLTNKLFADRERKKRSLEERANAEKKRRIDEMTDAADNKKVEEEFKKNFEESRDKRVGSWQKFVDKKKDPTKAKKIKGTFKPPKPKLETRPDAKPP